MNTVLHIDLDNTLIYREHAIPTVDKVCVEYYNNQPLSYMSRNTVNLLDKAFDKEGLLIVPTTTRTKTQFDRIALKRFKYVLVANGGMLLVDGNIDSDWYNESLTYTAACSEMLQRLGEAMKNSPYRESEIRNVADLFFYTKSEDPDRLKQRLRALLVDDSVSVLAQQNKVYVIPTKLLKGNAVFRLKRLLTRDVTVAAGDSEIDFSMIPHVDNFLTSNKDVSFPNGVLFNSTDFSAEILKYALRVREK